MVQSAAPADSRMRDIDARPQPVSEPRLTVPGPPQFRPGSALSSKDHRTDRDASQRAPSKTVQSGEVSEVECFALGSLVLLATGVAVPVSAKRNRAAGILSHIQQVYAQLVSELAMDDEQRRAHARMPHLVTEQDYDRCIRARTGDGGLSSSRWVSSRAVRNRPRADRLAPSHDHRRKR